MPGYPGPHVYGGLPVHHPLWGGPWALLDVTLPILMALVLSLLVAAASAGISRAEARRRRQPQPRHVVLRSEGQGRPILASDGERDEAAQTVSEAVGQGRLALDEAERRVEAVLRSRHRHELAALVADLPRRAPSKPVSRRSSSPLRPGLLVLTAVAVLAAVVVQAAVGLWELWPLAVVSCALLAARPRR